MERTSPVYAFTGTTIDQVGLVVRSLEQAIASFAVLGAGLWEIVEAFRGEAMVRGKPEVLAARLALAQFGNVQLELIQPLSGNSIYQEHLDAKGEGLHHLGMVVPDFEQRVAAAERQGIAVLQTMRFGRDSAYAYMDTTKTSGVVFEFITSSALVLKLFERVRSLGTGRPT